MTLWEVYWYIIDIYTAQDGTNHIFLVTYVIVERETTSA